MATSREHAHFRELSLALEAAPEGTASVAIAETETGAYLGLPSPTNTHLLDVSAELASLVHAVHAQDPKVRSVSVLFREAEAVSPSTMRSLADHARRTGSEIAYTVVGSLGEPRFETSSVDAELGFYEPPRAPLALSEDAPELPERREENDGDTEDLRRAAREGLARAFPTYDAASRYGAAVRTEEGVLYFGGQYSSFDGRGGLHAEMAAIVTALSRGARTITDIGVISSKYANEPCRICGCCRQFIADLSRERGWNPMLHLFANESGAVQHYELEELLPNAWHNHAV